jgi:putative flippase GtrA
MGKTVGLVVALLVFVAWIGLVGNPHVVETIIGLIIAVVSGFWVSRKFRPKREQ